MWDSICWLDHQKQSRYSNRLLPGITPKEEEEKSNKVFISGSQMKRIPCKCHKVLQEHNCFWALICFSAASTGGKGVNIVVNVFIHNLFCTSCDGPAWNHGRWCTEEKVLRVDLQYFIMENSLPQLMRAVTDTHLGSAFSEVQCQVFYAIWVSTLQHSINSKESEHIWKIWSPKHNIVMPGKNFLLSFIFTFLFT